MYKATLGCALLALTCMLAIASPASADMPPWKAKAGWGSVEFKSYGDVVTVHDLAADGYGVMAEIEIRPKDGGEWQLMEPCINTNGLAGVAEVCNNDYPEHYQVTFHLATIDKDGNTASEEPWSPPTSD